MKTKTVMCGLPQHLSKSEMVDYMADRLVEIQQDYKIKEHKIIGTERLEVIVEYKSEEEYVRENQVLRDKVERLEARVLVLEKLI